MCFDVVIGFHREHIKYANLRTLPTLFTHMCTVIYTDCTYADDACVSPPIAAEGINAATQENICS
jgi:hypothetical protein